MNRAAEIAFIGPGVMAEAMIAGLIRQGVAPAASIICAGPNAERCEELGGRYGIQYSTDNAEAVRTARIVVLAVKPQRLDPVLTDLKARIDPSALVVSIIAGATIDRISGGLAHAMIVRSMPNTPAQIGEGITVWTAAAAVTDSQKQSAREILGAFGDEVFLEEERFLDMATALSGTGPAYVFLFMEAMVDAGVHLGFSRRVAETLVAKTVRGSVDFYSNSDDPVHLARLRNQVTSPGGTSAAALYYLEKAGFRTAISRAIWAAYERSRELGIDVDAHSPEPSD
ncbi:MAG: pyrroline-5-carboxylate reductase [Thermoanaerobaculales bacterium]|nr:pyrroline-5-carboxylate reductase [Thermoanaerobaculales bacterium]